KTVTVITTEANQGPTTTVISNPFTKTLTMQPEAAAPVVITPVFEAQPPEIPHPFMIDNPFTSQVEGLVSETGGAICFECHGVPPQHNTWAFYPEICEDCHIVSNNPALVPHWPAPVTDIDS
ncbi:hypothetical protein ACFLYB_06490, partial [Chloroflexota bacterium]